MLADFEGDFVDGGEAAIISSLDISDKWLLAQQWVWEVQAAIIGATFGDAWVNYVFSSDKSQSTGFYYANHIMSFLARVLQTSSVINPINYPNWLAPIADLDLLIAEALDSALVSLGGLTARPWGVGQRPEVIYTNNILGPITFPNNNPPIANRAGILMAVEYDQNNGVSVSGINQIGQDSTILFNQYGLPELQDTAQQLNYINWDLQFIASITGQ